MAFNDCLATAICHHYLRTEQQKQALLRAIIMRPSAARVMHLIHPFVRPSA